MRVIIPLAGIGKRLRPHTLYCPKPLIFVAGNTILGYILNSLSQISPKEYIFVVNRGEDLMPYLKKYFSHIPFRFEIQEEPLGLGHAVYCGLRNIPNDSILILLGDTIINLDFKKYLPKGSFIGLKEVKDPRRFGVAIVRNNRVIEVEEKPNNPESNLAIVGIYFIKESEELKKALEEVIHNSILTQGEIQLTDALKIMCKKNYPFYPVRVEEWYDCGTIEALLSSNKDLLKKNFNYYEGINSTIISPCWIHPDVHIEDSVIGPFVSIDRDAEIRKSVISNSIINKKAKIEYVILENSVVGEKAKLIGKKLKLNFGPFSQTKII